MAEIINGKLIWQGEGKSRRRLLRWQNKKGEMAQPNRFPDEQLAADLRERQENEIDVHLELENGQPRRIRLVDEAWVLPPRTSPTPRRAGTSGTAGTTEKRNQEPGGLKSTETKARKHGSENEMPKLFHNPYNFIPAPPRDSEKVRANGLGDCEPIGHDRYYDEHYTGLLRVKMTVKTPLLLPDTSRVKITGSGKNEHRSYPVRVGLDGKPHIQPTAIKGMLRAAYEASTNSRLSVFNGHNKPLAFRAPAEDGITVVPARVEKDGANWCVTLLTGTSQIEEDGGPKYLNPKDPRDGREEMYAAWLRRYKWHGDGAPIISGVSDEHGKKVWAYIRRWQHGPFDFWNVVELQPHSSTKPTTHPRETRSISSGRNTWRNAGEADPTRNGEWVEGYICHNNLNIGRKHDERVFFNPGPAHIKFVVDSKQWTRLRNNWQILLEDYEATDHRGLDAGVSLSRHIDKADEERVLDVGVLCYARVVKEGGPAQNRIRKVWPTVEPIASLKKGSDTWLLFELNPVMISRRLHPLSPIDLLDNSLTPATSLSELSPADRVFGWVSQEDGKGAYRGQLRIGTVECTRDDAIDNLSQENEQQDPNRHGLPLAILGQPKPQQGRFYVAADQSGNAQGARLPTEEAGYNETAKGLRGRKVYPHHKGTTEDHWENAGEDRTQRKTGSYYQEYRRSHEGIEESFQDERGRWKKRLRRDRDGNFILSGKEQRDNQNRSIHGWVKPTTEFEFTAHVTNLSAVELGALMWLLSLNTFEKDQAAESENGETVEYFHRLGGGKPLGFGSVRLDIIWSEIHSGQEMKKRYQSLDGAAQAYDADAAVAAFKQAVQSGYGDGESFNDIRFIKAFLTAASGFSDGLPIHYPRSSRSPNPLGESFKWFVNNAKKGGPKLALRDLDEPDPGLPIL